MKDVKEDKASGKHAYCIVHTSFQSTGGTNLQSVNVLSKVSLYVHQRERGRGAGKRRWGIEMNEHRQLYLGNYCTMDQVDAGIKSLRQYYICWKWWHAPMRHFYSYAIVLAHRIYVSCCNGEVHPDWKCDDKSTIMSIADFHYRLSCQQLHYSPKNRHYPGDQNFRPSTQEHKK